MKLDSTMTVGCDLGDKKSDLCVLSQGGAILHRQRMETSRRGLHRFFADQSRVVVVLEASVHSAWVSRQLGELGHRTIVANPRRVQLIAKGKSKSDRVDAELLARLGRVDPGLLSPIQHRGIQAQVDLAMVRSRATLVETRTKLVNHVRGIVKSCGERVRKCHVEVFVKRATPDLPDSLRETLAPILSVIDRVTVEIKAIDRKIDKELPERYPEIIILRTVDCIGPLTALTYVLTIDDPTRFSKSRKAGAYLGLCPARRQSGGGDPELRITRCGDAYLRSLLINCAQRMLGPFGKDSDLRRWGLELAERGKKNAKKRAVVAIARRLAVLLHRLSITGEVWVPLGYGTSAKAA